MSAHCSVSEASDSAVVEVEVGCEGILLLT